MPACVQRAVWLGPSYTSAKESGSTACPLVRFWTLTSPCISDEPTFSLKPNDSRCCVWYSNAGATSVGARVSIVNDNGADVNERLATGTALLADTRMVAWCGPSESALSGIISQVVTPGARSTNSSNAPSMNSSTNDPA